MDAIKGKIQSRQGASITFALMVFLVCAVVSSVVIVSASTVSGRMSGLREMDARYYAVTGVGEELCETLDSASVKVTATKAEDNTVTATATYTDDSAIANKQILKTLSEKLIEKSLKHETDVFVLPASFTDKDISVDGKTYKCSVNGKLQGGQATFDISVGETAARVYKLSITFSSNVKTVAGAEANTTVSTVEWKLREIRRNRAAAPTTTSNP